MYPRHSFTLLSGSFFGISLETLLIEKRLGLPQSKLAFAVGDRFGAL